jgi:hypothetical protein
MGKGATSYDNGDAASDAGAAHTQASLIGHAYGWRPPAGRMTGAAVTTAPETIDFDLGGTDRALGARVYVRNQTGMNLLAATKVARGQMAERGLSPATPKAADAALRELCRREPEERPKLPLVRISGENGSTAVAVALCRNREPAFEDDGTSLAPPEFFLLVTPVTESAEDGKRNEEKQTTA